VTPHTGSWAVWSGGDDNELSYIQQSVTVPAASPYLAYWHWIASAEVICGADIGMVQVNGTTVDQYNLCSSEDTFGWVLHVVNLGTYGGQTVQLRIGSATDGSLNSNLFVDDVAFQASPIASASTPVAPPALGSDLAKSRRTINP
jgi:hypothetical protein